jgi:hypothetical protein
MDIANLQVNEQIVTCTYWTCSYLVACRRCHNRNREERSPIWICTFDKKSSLRNSSWPTLGFKMCLVVFSSCRPYTVALNLTYEAKGECGVLPRIRLWLYRYWWHTFSQRLRLYGRVWVETNGHQFIYSRHSRYRLLVRADDDGVVWFANDLLPLLPIHLRARTDTLPSFSVVVPACPLLYERDDG